MGGGPSKTRKLVVENEDPTNVIKVSEEVVDRIRGNQLNQTVRQELLSPQPALVQPLYLNEPSLTTIQLRQANVEDLKKNDEYWESRLKNMETNHKKINEVMDEEYNKAVEEIRGKRVPTAQNIEPPCLSNKKAVMDCYKCYPDEPMRCAKLVQAFQECVDFKRSCLMASRG